MVAMKN
jgi:hypothetical protein